MKATIITPAALPAEALAEVKQWLAITTPHDDATLSTLLRTALEMCEAYTGLTLLESECEEMLPLSAQWQKLTARPVQAITTVAGLPIDDPRFAYPSDAYAIDLDDDGGARVRVMRPGIAARFAVRFTAGMASRWEALPDALRHGVIRLVAHQHRERDNPGAASLPTAAVTALWRPWRRLRLA